MTGCETYNNDCRVEVSIVVDVVWAFVGCCSRIAVEGVIDECFVGCGCPCEQLTQLVVTDLVVGVSVDGARRFVDGATADCAIARIRYAVGQALVAVPGNIVGAVGD